MKFYESFSNNIIAYHGTNKNFDEFDISHSGISNDPGDYGKGIYFDTDAEWALSYAHSKLGFLLKAEIHLSNPYYINFKKYSSYNREFNDNTNNQELIKYINALNEGGAKIPPPVKDTTFLTISRTIKAENVTKYLQNQNYDGVIVDYGNSKEIVVFDVNAIIILSKQKTSEIN